MTGSQDDAQSAARKALLMKKQFEKEKPTWSLRLSGT
jgi:hypothetical protein